MIPTNVIHIRRDGPTEYRMTATDPHGDAGVVHIYDRASHAFGLGLLVSVGSLVGGETISIERMDAIVDIRANAQYAADPEQPVYQLALSSAPYMEGYSGYSRKSWTNKRAIDESYG